MSCWRRNFWTGCKSSIEQAANTSGHSNPNFSSQQLEVRLTTPPKRASRTSLRESRPSSNSFMTRRPSRRRTGLNLQEYIGEFLFFQRKPDIRLLVRAKTNRIRPPLRILVGHLGCIGNALQLALNYVLARKHRLQFTCFGDEFGFDIHHGPELLKLADQNRFDLIIFYSSLCSENALSMFTELRARFRKPIICCSSVRLSACDLGRYGIDAFLICPPTVSQLHQALTTAGVFG
jgi:hypothetical protein